MAGWLHLYIDKTTLENQVFPIYQKYIENPEDPHNRTLLPMFDWLNFERRSKER